MGRYKLRMNNEYTRATTYTEKMILSTVVHAQIIIDYDERCYRSSYRIGIGFLFCMVGLCLCPFLCRLCTLKPIG